MVPAPLIPESAEGLPMHLRAGAGPVEIKIADAEFVAGLLQVPRAAGIDGAGERKVAEVGNFQGVGKIARGNDGPGMGPNNSRCMSGCRGSFTSRIAGGTNQPPAPAGLAMEGAHVRARFVDDFPKPVVAGLVDHRGAEGNRRPRRLEGTRPSAARRKRWTKVSRMLPTRTRREQAEHFWPA